MTGQLALCLQPPAKTDDTTRLKPVLTALCDITKGLVQTREVEGGGRSRGRHVLTGGFFIKL